MLGLVVGVEEALPVCAGGVLLVFAWRWLGARESGGDVFEGAWASREQGGVTSVLLRILRKSVVAITY